jgi:hypothetical protein
MEQEARLEKERQELYAELQRQEAQKTHASFALPPTTTATFGKVSEQEAIAWLRQQ